MLFSTTRLTTQLDDRHSWTHRGLLFGIILLGFLLRWYSLYEGHAYIYFAINDEISALQYAFELLAGNPHALYLGQPVLNQGHIPGPIWAMFVAALYKLGGNSVEGAIFVMVLLNTLVIYLVYLLASKLMPTRYALFSALFYALAPWAIYYSAGIYNPMPLALFGVLLFLALWQTLNVDDSRAVFWVMLLSAAVPQIHMIGVFYYPAILLLLVISPAKLNGRWLAAGMVAGVVLYLPYLIGEITHDWSNLRGVLSGSSILSSGIIKIITIPIGMLTNHPGQWPGYTTPELIEFANKWFGSYLLLLFINAISLILALLFVSSFVRKFYIALRSARFNIRTALLNDQIPVYLGILLILPLLIYILLGKSYTTRYSIFIFPLLFLLPGLFIAGIKSQRFRHAVLYSLFVMLLCNIYLVTVFYLDQDTKISSSSQYMPAFYKLEALTAALVKDSGPDTVIEINTSKYIDKNNKYSKIAAAAVTEYVTLQQARRMPSAELKHIQQYEMVNAQAEVPDKAKIVYRDNGMILFTWKSVPD